MKKQKYILVAAPVLLEDLVDSMLSSLSFDEIVKLIKTLDKGCEDWGVTERLFNYFREEMKGCPQDE
tara:strand:+ start:8462 stop:8662 length:201 start_codon:yes stop_codon:yes gene_type:complete